MVPLATPLDPSSPHALQSHQTALLVFVRFVLWWVCVKGSPAAGNHFRKVARGVGRFVTWPWGLLMVQTKPDDRRVGHGQAGGDSAASGRQELDADDYEMIKAVIGAYVCLFNAVGDKNTTIRRLRQMLFGAKTEKTSAVIGGLKDAEECAGASGGDSRAGVVRCDRS